MQLSRASALLVCAARAVLKPLTLKPYTLQALGHASLSPLLQEQPP